MSPCGAALLALLLALPPLVWRAAKEPGTPTSSGEFRIDGRTQGTTYRVRAFGGDPAPTTQESVRGRVDAELRRIDELMSAWRDDSEIERFNQGPADVPFLLSPETARVLEQAERIWRATHGAFDPAIGRVIRLWGFGGAPRRSDVPSQEDIRAALLAGGFANVEREGRTMIKRRAGLCIDLSGIAQGFAVDRIFDLMTGLGYRSVLVEIGGEVRAGAPPPREGAWRIGLEEPDGSGALHATLAVRDAAVSTSGDYRAAFETGGMRFSHIIDPHDGWPIRTGVASATVVARDSTTADALATGLMVLGADRALALVESLPEVDCLLLVRRGNGLEEVRSHGMSRWLGKGEAARVLSSAPVRPEPPARWSRARNLEPSR
jgi:FAD:protein FMN transferase